MKVLMKVQSYNFEVSWAQYPAYTLSLRIRFIIFWGFCYTAIER